MRNVVSYGGGTQSTAMILMALNGEYGLERPDFGVWADVGAEPEFIYDYVYYFIDYVKKKYNFDIFVCKYKNRLEDELSYIRTKKSGGEYIRMSVPYFTLSDKGEKGMIKRQCTGDYKINPVKKLINSKLERAEPYRKWIGISFDERSRMKISPEKKVTNYYPFVDNFIRRDMAIDYVVGQGLKKPQRSSCYFCPFHSDEYWLWLKKYHIKEFNKACDFEIKSQMIVKSGLGVIRDMVYVHSSCKPLAEVKFDNENQLNLFPHLIDECDGECGI